MRRIFFIFVGLFFSFMQIVFSASNTSPSYPKPTSTGAGASPSYPKPTPTGTGASPSYPKPTPTGTGTKPVPTKYESCLKFAYLNWWNDLMGSGSSFESINAKHQPIVKACESLNTNSGGYFLK